MNFFKKIKCFLFIFICFSLPLTSFAQKNSYNATTTNENSNYINVLNDFYSLRQTMINDIQHNQGQQWLSFLLPGVQRNEVLFVWLYSDWLYYNHQMEKSYEQAIKAFFLSELSIQNCAQSSPTILNTFYSLYQPILEQPVSPQRKQKILFSLFNTLDQNLLQNKYIPIMMCQFIQVNIYKKNKTKKFTINVLQPKDIPPLLKSQKNYFSQLKIKYQYQKMWDNTTINDVYIQ